ncbi:MAG: hypothetical protein OXL98_07215 [Acidimicrobiaceae bacterium]|nr:hypothetical protein [Acidimicrobiaceae bacterium]
MIFVERRRQRLGLAAERRRGACSLPTWDSAANLADTGGDDPQAGAGPHAGLGCTGGDDPHAGLGRTPVSVV